MADLVRVSIFGALPGGEEWSINPCYTLADFGTPVSPAQAQTIATAIAAVAVPAGLLATMISSTTVTGARVEAREQTGELETQAEALKTTAQAGTGSVAHPFQTSLCLSLRTAQVGPSGRGRLYWPATGFALGTAALRPSAANVDTAVAAAKTYLSGIQTAITATLGSSPLIVWSRKTSGRFAVNRIQAGDVLDVQRRRRDTLIENYSSVSYP